MVSAALFLLAQACVSSAFLGPLALSRRWLVGAAGGRWGRCALGTGATTIEVGLGDRSYPIYLGRGLFDGDFASKALRNHLAGDKVLVVTNAVVGPLHLKKVVDALERDPRNIIVETLLLPDGEEEKTMSTIMKIMDKALETRMDRQSSFVALGGGVVGDMVGFAAAIYQRGVNFIQVPTTLMAMVDSSVGGKTGVNHPLGKNMVGSFHQPSAVLIDTSMLDTLPDRELASGIAEVVKYGLIRDAEFFAWQEAHMDRVVARDHEALATVIEWSCRIKAEVVVLDEREAGVRATLNLGHTFGHAIETGLGYGSWLHGEAVSVGMVMAADLSYRLGLIDASILGRATALLKRAGLPVTLPPDCPLTMSQMASTMSVDKKASGGVMRLVLLSGELGRSTVTRDFNTKVLHETLQSFLRAN
jgi:3-dehydroquinate synthase